MVVVATGLTEAELLEYIRKYYSDADAERMVKTAREYGDSFYGAFAVNKVRFERDGERTYNLLRIPGYMPPERSADDA